MTEYISSKYTSKDIYDLFQLLYNKSIDEIIYEIETFIANDLEDSKIAKIFRQLVDTADKNLDNFRYMFDIYLNANFEGIIQLSFKLFYERFLTPRNFEPNKKLRLALQKQVNYILESDNSFDFHLPIENRIDKSVEELFEYYNSIVSSLEYKLCVKLINEFLKQYIQTFKDFYITKFAVENKFDIYKSIKNKLNIDDQVFSQANAYSSIYYSTVPWLHYEVLELLITPPIRLVTDIENETQIIPFDSIKNSFIKPKIFEESGIQWYKPNNNFFNMLCNQRLIKSQKDSVLIFRNSENKLLLTVSILYRIWSRGGKAIADPTSFIIQDEELFKEEQKFFNNLKLSKELTDYSVNYFLDQPLDFNILTLGNDIIQTNLKLCNIQHNKYSKVALTHDIIKESNITTNRAYVTKIAELTIFMYLEQWTDSIFRKRLIKGYYKPDSLFKLPLYEKIPELFNSNRDLSLEEIDLYREWIDQRIQNETYILGESFFITKNYLGLHGRYKRKFENIDINAPIIHDKDNEEFPLQHLEYRCKNETGNNPEDYIYYNEGENDICINIITFFETVIPSLPEELQKQYTNYYDNEDIIKNKTISPLTPLEEKDTSEINNKVLFPYIYDIINDILSFDSSAKIDDLETNIFFILPSPKELEYEDKVNEAIYGKIEDENEDETNEDEIINLEEESKKSKSKKSKVIDLEEINTEKETKNDGGFPNTGENIAQDILFINELEDKHKSQNNNDGETKQNNNNDNDISSILSKDDLSENEDEIYSKYSSETEDSFEDDFLDKDDNENDLKNEDSDNSENSEDNEDSSSSSEDTDYDSSDIEDGFMDEEEYYDSDKDEEDSKFIIDSFKEEDTNEVCQLCEEEPALFSSPFHNIGNKNKNGGAVYKFCLECLKEYDPDKSFTKNKQKKSKRKSH